MDFTLKNIERDNHSTVIANLEYNHHASQIYNMQLSVGKEHTGWCYSANQNDNCMPINVLGAINVMV